MTTHAAFFYGTLMHPPVLHRVVHSNPNPPGDLKDLHTFHPAILHNYRRRRVRWADYPGLTAHDGSDVRGSYVTGLRDQDIRLLDVFEGTYYERVKVKVELLDGDRKGEEVEASTYLFIQGEDLLEDGEWDFEEFRREKANDWSGSLSWEDDGFEDADELREKVQEDSYGDPTGGRGANGHISRELEGHRVKEQEEQ